MPRLRCKYTWRRLEHVQVNGRIIRKRIHVRVEHVEPSRCREDFLARRTQHEDLKKEAKASGSALLPPCWVDSSCNVIKERVMLAVATCARHDVVLSSSKLLDGLFAESPLGQAQ